MSKLTFALLIASSSIFSLSLPQMANAEKADWEVRAGAIFLDRDASYDGAFICEGPGGTGPPLIGQSEVETGVQGGFDFEATRNLSQTTAVNTRFFFVDDWTSGGSAVTANGAYICGSAVAGGNVDNVVAAFSSNLYSAEVNIVKQYKSWLQLLGGLRWLSIGETGNAQFRNGATPDGVYNGSVNNDLFGFQLGANALLIDRGPFNVDCTMKGGFYGNDASNDGSYVNGVILNLGDSDSGFAFVGELGINGNLQITNKIWVTAGYQLLWVDGIAILTQQPAAYSWGAGNGIYSDGDALYHGAVVSLTVLLP